MSLQTLESKMEEFVKVAFDIISFSCIMVLVVSGLAIIASLMGIFNFAHGEFVLLGAYTVYVFRELGMPEWSGMVAAVYLLTAMTKVRDAFTNSAKKRAPVSLI